ncbi:MAG: EamA family transporter [Maritimibacter sp.]|nr:EamA family transporter [Maritimibacter sp.]
MQRKDHIDAFGAVTLICFAVALGFNQVVVKVANDGLQPVFAAALRSLLALPILLAWIRLRGQSLYVEPAARPWCALMGVVFAVEFVCLFLALDLTSVARTSVIFYGMPVWLALLAHILVPGDRLSPRKAAGLALAMAGVAVAILSRGSGGEVGLAGDLLALAASLLWALIALLTKVSPFSRVPPAQQLTWQIAVSVPVLFAFAAFFGPAIRDFDGITAAALGFQILLVSAGFLLWMWLMKIYPASGVTSFSFLSPVVGVFFGWLLLGETVGYALWVALALVAAGLVLVNRPPRTTSMSAQTGK